MKVSAGVIDAAISSGSGFVLSVAAANILAPVELGVYAVFFAAYSLAMALPTELAFTSAEIAAIELPEHQRVAVLKGSLRSGGLLAVAGAFLTLFSIPVVLAETDVATILAVAVPTVTAAMFGPVEEHVRKLLHSAGRSRDALVASVVMFVGAIGGVFLFRATGMPDIAVPMAALTLANVASLVAGLIVSRTALAHDVSHIQLGLRRLAGTGRWLLVVGFVPALAAFATSAIVTWLAGAVAMGHAEAARAVGQPIFVIGVGLLRVLGPRSMEAARDGDAGKAGGTARLYRRLLVGGSLLYRLVTATPWVLNPFSYLIEPAYAVPGLVAAIVVANMTIGLGFPERSELLAVGRARRVARVEWLATALTVGAAATAGAIGAFAYALSRQAPATYRVVSYLRQQRALYGEPEARSEMREA